jgi:hypothetical protein
VARSSADPTELAHLAAAERALAEHVLVALAPLDDAVARVWRGADPVVVGSYPEVVAETRTFASRVLAEADFVSRVAHAFEAADGAGSGHGPVVADDARLVAAFAATTPALGLFHDLRSMSPGRLGAILRELGPATLDALLADHPAWMGSTDGVPLDLRYRANHQQVLADLAAAEAAGNASAARRLRVLTHDQVVLYDPDGGRVAVAFGDVSRAEHVAITVPGVGESFSTFVGRPRTDGANLAAEMERQSRRGAATIAWLGYRPPSNIVAGTVDDAARRGGDQLTAFVHGLGLTARQSLTMVGHSYGTIVVSRAEAGGAGARNVVLLGSPGVEKSSAAKIGAPADGGVYVERAPGDYVAITEAYGTDPSAPRFGAVRMTTNAPGRPEVSFHSRYFEKDSEALRNTAAVATGHDPEVQRATAGERIVDGKDHLDELTGGTLDPRRQAMDFMARHYHGPGHEAFQAADRVLHGVHGITDTAERNLIDRGVDFAKEVTKLPHSVIDVPSLLP